MGIRPSLNTDTVGPQTVDVKIGESYSVVKSVEENLDALNTIADNIVGLAAINDSLDDLLTVEMDIVAAGEAATTATTKASEASVSAGLADTSRIAAELAETNAEAAEAGALASANTATTKASEASADSILAQAAVSVSGGYLFAYSTTTTDADPGAGIFRLNHATIASVTAAYIDNNDAAGNVVAPWIDTFDDSSSTTKGLLILRSTANPNTWATFKVTSTVVDGTGYRKLTLIYVGSNGTFTNGVTFSVSFYPAGDAGSGAVSTINGQFGAVTLNTDDLSDAGHTNKWATAAEKTKLGFVTVTQAVDLDAIEAAAMTTVSAHIDAASVVAFVDGDHLTARQASGGALIKDTWASIKTAMGTALGVPINNLTAKTTLANADEFSIYDSASVVAKKITWANFQTQMVVSAGTEDQYRLNTPATLLSNNQVWSAAGQETLADGTTIAVDMGTFLNASVTLGGNRTLGNPTNTKVGQTGYIRIVQDATGSRTLTYSSNWEFGGGVAPVLTTTADAVDILFYQVLSATSIFASLVRNVS